ncbi:unnamed protein product [[Actinomadura] parvosata subsp. kistnae]|uniref:hypothetical protein n=1 Tax=[Actinomadura] parvosata TaxID=1955412 RepID=UPI000D29A25C|nr:unnamed protein product [Actinomadura parvosata subsp. kistnae]
MSAAIFAAFDMEIDDGTGRILAAELEHEYAGMAVVLWEVAGRHFTAFWRGHVPVPVYVKARTPQELRAAVAARLYDLRLEAEAERLPRLRGGSFPVPQPGRGMG